MKKILLLPAVSLSLSYGHAQTSVRDSLKQLLQKETADTNKVLLLRHLSFTYIEFNPGTELSCFKCNK